MNISKELSRIKNNLDIDKKLSTNWNKELFQLCSSIPLPITTMKCQIGYHLFRARKVDNIMVLQKWNRKDFVARKAYDVDNYGRLNKPYEEIMYFNNDYRQALKEIHYDYNTPVVISAYKVVAPFKSTRIAYENENQPIDIESKACLDWFRDLFADNTDIAPDISNQITTAIREDFYTLPIDVAQAWSYPIVGEQIRGVHNIAMYPDPARKHLEFEGAIVISDANLEGRMNVEFCFDSDYRLDYVKSYPELKKIFGLE